MTTRVFNFGLGLILAVLLFVFFGAVICPEHGVRSTATGNRRYADRHTYCEYEHPLYMGGVHKFWALCD